MSSATYPGDMSIGHPPARPFTVGDLEGMPDDGRRHELIDGTLVVTPAPSYVHPRAVLRLAVLLDDAIGDDLEVLVAPFEWRPNDSNSFQPDVLVFRRADVDPDLLRVPPVLAIGVLLPSTRSIDLAKLDAYGRSGLDHYWVVDPLAPSLAVYGRDAGGLVRTASVSGDEAHEATVPVALRVVPADLVR